MSVSGDKRSRLVILIYRSIIDESKQSGLLIMVWQSEFIRMIFRNKLSFKRSRSGFDSYHYKD